ncbi:hypothetical protein U9M48_005497 [Paspalum notatum var. saurae]|uniref:F-box domain-containing protein n=1 Tax=Paspalum notatum var. saurae TaxID=547442 RepID=A0AAQ3PSE1_PASNO
MEPPSPSGVAAEGADLLSSLPAALLDEILTRLDLRDAVRTSALSRAWRRRWESVAGLALCFPEGTPPGAVDRVLFQYTCPDVSRFAFDADDGSVSHVDHWLIALSRRRSVESIAIRWDVGTSDPDDFALHSSIFSCAGLVSLRLHWCSIPPLPVGFAGFPVLEELYLGNVLFSDYGQLQAIVRGSPLLRVLSLEDGHDYADMIAAPNLHSLTLHSEYDSDWRFGELPCLQDAYICAQSCLLLRYDFGRFFAGFAQVRKLTFFSPVTEVNISTTPFTFYNLKSLELSTHFVHMSTIFLMFCLLRSSPNLEKLKIQTEGSETIANWEFLNTQWTDGMCANLQIVEIISFRQWLPISLLKLILSKASLLRTLSVDACPQSQDDPLNELLKCRKTSAQAQVLFKFLSRPLVVYAVL